MQTALILDSLRAAQYMKESVKEFEVTELLLCGHSMGGAAALVVASKLKVGEEAVLRGVGGEGLCTDSMLVARGGKRLLSPGNPACRVLHRKW